MEFLGILPIIWGVALVFSLTAPEPRRPRPYRPPQPETLDELCEVMRATPGAEPGRWANHGH